MAPISGPHDFSGPLGAALAGEITAAPHYLAYLVVAWNRLHHLYDEPAEAFLPPHDTVVESLFDGHHGIDEIVSGLPVITPEALFTPAFLAALRQPSGPLRDAPHVADSTCDWRPAVPVQLYGANGDRDVPIANTEHCEETLQGHGADVRLVDVGEVDHFGSVVLSLPRIVEQFDQIAE